MSDLMVDISVRRKSFELSLNTELSENKITVVFGPSGSGKSSLLKAIAGTEPCTGTIKTANLNWQSDKHHLSANKRELGYLPQGAELFHHLSVLENIDYGRVRRQFYSEQERDWVVEQLGLKDFVERDVSSLSGGQKQRVAIARAILATKGWLLLDEPLVGLDAINQRKILLALKSIKTTFNLSIIYITHSITELLTIADSVVLLDQGQCIGHAAIEKVVSEYGNVIFEDALPATVFDITVTELMSDFHLAKVEFQELQLIIPDNDYRLAEQYRCVLKANQISISVAQPKQSSTLNVLQGKVLAINASFHPGVSIVDISVSGITLSAAVTNLSVRNLELAPGHKVWCQIKTAALL